MEDKSFEERIAALEAQIADLIAQQIASADVVRALHESTLMAVQRVWGRTLSRLDR